MGAVPVLSRQEGLARRRQRAAAPENARRLDDHATLGFAPARHLSGSSRAKVRREQIRTWLRSIELLERWMAFMSVSDDLPSNRVNNANSADAKLQERSLEVWGRAPLASEIPTVQAYRGPLPDGKRGVEFETDVPPDRWTPPLQANWSGPRPGVRVEDGFARIEVKWPRNHQK